MRLSIIVGIVVSSGAYALGVQTYIYTPGTFSPPAPLPVPSVDGGTAVGVTSSGIVWGLTNESVFDITADFYDDPTGADVYGGGPVSEGPPGYEVIYPQLFYPYVSPNGYVAGTIVAGIHSVAEPIVLYAPNGAVTYIQHGTEINDQLLVGGVNDLGQVVGEEASSEGDDLEQPFIYEGGSVLSLNSLIVNPPPGGILNVSDSNLLVYSLVPSNGLTIDDNGIIYGGGFKLTPTPEPAMLPIIGISFLFLARQRKAIAG